MVAATNQVKEVQALDAEQKQILEKIANTIRGLSMDAVQQANSGHPGLPMGCAEIGAYLYGVALRHNPQNPHWWNRDRMILSAGHGSMWLYSCLHLSGFDVSLDDIKHFRQLHSKTPGHPESLDTPGVETTTGPLGQGLGNAVGQAFGLKILGKRFNRGNENIFDSKVFCLVSDGDIMEGVSHESSSLAGFWKLDNLIVIYDSNHICLDGPTSECLSEDTKARYKAYGWEVYEVDGSNLDALHSTISKARQTQQGPVFILAHTIIGKGSPNKAGTNKAHGSPLGEEEVKLSKQALGIPEEKFYIPQAVINYFAARLEKDRAAEEQWKQLYNNWGNANSDLKTQLEAMHADALPENLENLLSNLAIVTPMATRSSSQKVLELLADHLPQIYGGSADLSGSDMTFLKKYPLIAPGAFEGRNIKFGVREFGMATIATGLNQTGFMRPYVGTFLTFSDYMRNAVRLAALQRQKVVYQFTHDSIFLGEDGPTHQPIEHLAALRAIPNLYVIRPADANEVKMAWLAALLYHGPVALILSRQNLPELPHTKVAYANGMARGAYIIKKETRPFDYLLLATGSEVSLALDVAQALEKHDRSVRVVSMPCWELFEAQDAEYKASILDGGSGIRVSIEAASEMGWHRYIGRDGIAIAMETFGASAPASELAKEFGFTVESILERIMGA